VQAPDPGRAAPGAQQPTALQHRLPDSPAQQPPQHTHTKCPENAQYQRSKSLISYPSRSCGTLRPPQRPSILQLNVPRLSRPSLSEQLTLPPSGFLPELESAAQHAHAYPSHPSGDAFIHTPLLTLPPSFGSVHIGETFSCILSASNESTSTSVGDVKIQAQMQTPSQTVQLTYDEEDSAGADLAPGTSTQKTVAYELKEEGGHTLAVMVSYTPDSGATRTFKKLYQFVAQQCIMVRTKAGRLPGTGKAILEAQLENLSEAPVALQKVSMKSRWKWQSLNWDIAGGGGGSEEVDREVPLLRSRDVLQVAFLLEPSDEGAERGGDEDYLGVLNIEWRSSCGDRGFLRTGKLMLPPLV
jgi:hypothetical protein